MRPIFSFLATQAFALLSRRLLSGRSCPEKNASLGGFGEEPAFLQSGRHSFVLQSLVWLHGTHAHIRIIRVRTTTTHIRVRTTTTHIHIRTTAHVASGGPSQLDACRLSCDIFHPVYRL